VKPEFIPQFALKIIHFKSVFLFFWEERQTSWRRHFAQSDWEMVSVVKDITQLIVIVIEPIPKPGFFKAIKISEPFSIIRNLIDSSRFEIHRANF
jgi:hypothetical protein